MSSFDESTLGHVLTIVLIMCVKNIFTMCVVNFQRKREERKKKQILYGYFEKRKKIIYKCPRQNEIQLRKFKEEISREEKL